MQTAPPVSEEDGGSKDGDEENTDELDKESYFDALNLWVSLLFCF